MEMPYRADEYDLAARPLDDFGSALCGLVEEVLRSAGLRVHRVDYRVKTRESAARKISRNGDRNLGYPDLLDLLGLRVITYFEDDVDRVAGALTGEFEVDPANSVDKRLLLDPDRFGYMSLHYVMKLGRSRLALVEYQRYAGLCFEIQIRSILQHSWAEIEHDLGYKSEVAVPRDARRRFSMLAGLLEFADAEFVRLKDELTAYDDHVRTAIGDSTARLELDQSTLAALLDGKKLRRLDRQIAACFPTKLEGKLDQAYIGVQVEDLAAVGVASIEELSDLIDERYDHIHAFAKAWLRRGDGDDRRQVDSVSRGISVFYLLYTLLADESISDRPPSFQKIQDDWLEEAIRETWLTVVEEIGTVHAWSPTGNLS